MKTTIVKQYRIEKCGLSQLPLNMPDGIDPLNVEWALISNRDDEIISVHATKEMAEIALSKAHARHWVVKGKK